jgi:hypothetical protein
MESACRCTIFHSPSSGLKIIVTLRVKGVMSCLPPSLLPHYPHSVGKLSSHVLHYHLEASDLTVSELRHAPWSQKPAPTPARECLPRG